MAKRLFVALVFLFLVDDLSLAAPPIGFSYRIPTASTDDNLPSPELITDLMSSLGFSRLRLLDPQPRMIQAFTGTPIYHLLTIPNALVIPMAISRSTAFRWLFNHVPAHGRPNIHMISVGDELLGAAQGVVAPFLLSAIQNVHFAIQELGIKGISVSTCFSFRDIMSSFPLQPSKARFKEPDADSVIKPILGFLEDIDSPLLLTVHTYQLYRDCFDITCLRSCPEEIICLLHFGEHEDTDWRDSANDRFWYHNFFPMLIDVAGNTLKAAGYENLPLVIVETGWPSSCSDPTQSDIYMFDALLFLDGVLNYLKAANGSIVKGVYVFEVRYSKVKKMSHTCDLVDEDPGWFESNTGKEELPLVQPESFSDDSRKLKLAPNSIRLKFVPDDSGKGEFTPIKTQTF